MENIRKEVIDWFNSPQDYEEGLELLQKVSRRNRIIGKLIKRGETRASFEKIVWELNKIALLKRIPVPTAKVESKIVRIDPAVTPKKEKPKKKEKASAKIDGKVVEEKVKFSLIGKRDIETLPASIQKVVRENSSLYMLRGKKHKALTSLPDDNSEETVAKRVELMGEKSSMSKRLEVLFVAWSTFEETGVEPDAAALWPAAEKSKGIKAVALSVDELKNLKKNIQSSITKDRNQLTYSSKTKGKEEKPMQAGPKRTTLEKRVAKKEKEIINIDQQIADLG